MRIKFLLCLGFLLFSLFPKLSWAENSYYYKESKVEIWLNQDGTIDITEKDTFILNGQLEKLSRRFLGKRIDYFTNLEVLDEKGIPVERKDHTFYNSKSKEESSIEWLIPKEDYLDGELSYTLKYKVYGAVSFLTEQDELIWDLLPPASNLQKVEAIVHLPANIKKEEAKISLESDAITVAKDIYQNDSSVYQIIKDSEFTRPVAAYYLADDNTAYFIGQNLKKGASFSPKIVLPKGVIIKPKVSFGQAINWLIGLGLVIVLIIYFIYYRTLGKKRLSKEKEKEDKLSASS